MAVEQEDRKRHGAEGGTDEKNAPVSDRFGQEAEADPPLAEAALEVMRLALPASPRDGLPFGPPVEPAPGAGATERLANWLGRDTAPWVRRERT